MRYFISALILLAVLSAHSAFAQTLQVDGHFTASKWSEFDDIDNGFGGRLTFKPISLIGIEADATWYPGDYEPDGTAFSRNRFEGLFGVTVGPKIGRVRPFAKAGGGFLKVGATPGAFACIAIFPPPLACKLAGGETLAAYEIGGGIELDATSRVFLRADVADRILKYPGPTFDSDFQVRDEGYFGHALRFTVGAGIRVF